MAVVAVAMEVLLIEGGHWCRSCLLSSGVRIWFVTRTGPASTLRSGLRCTDCGGDDIEVGPVVRTVWPAP